jgi:hypothetical protein
MAEKKRYATVGYKERIDHLSERLLGEAECYREILDLNPELDVWHPQTGMTIEVPEK